MKNHAAIVCVNDEEGNFRLLFTGHGIQGRVSHVILSPEEAARVIKLLTAKVVDVTCEALLWALRTLPVGCPACGYRLDEPKRVECTEDHRNMAALLPAPDEVKP